MIDISDRNFWLVEMLPFSSDYKKNYEFVKEYQDMSINYDIFGIGWSNDTCKKIFKDIEIQDDILTDEKKQKLRENIEKNNLNLELPDGNSILNIFQKVCNVENRSITNFFNIKKNDVILSRLRNGKYIIGIVKDGNKVYGPQKEKGVETEILERYNASSQGFGWRCYVRNWYEFSREEVPADIIGRCSQRYPSTITRIDDDRIKLFILKLLKQKGEDIKINCPPIVLNENNFASALNPDELEDLVYLYILEKEEKEKNKDNTNDKNNQNLILLPSNCKVSEPLYEFFLLDKNDKKYITCQVKNRSAVEFSRYKHEIDNDKKIKKIYLFSGFNKYGNDKEKENYKGKIEEINRSELWETLKSKRKYFNMLQNEKFYVIDDDSINENNTINLSKISYNDDWSILKYNERKNGKKKFNINFYDDNGNILTTSAEKYQDNDEIFRNRISSIEFYYYYNNRRFYFYYNNEFKCYIINNANNEEERKEIEKIIEEVKPIVQKITKGEDN